MFYVWLIIALWIVFALGFFTAALFSVAREDPWDVIAWPKGRGD